MIQTTSLADVGHWLKKVRARPELAAWLWAGGRFEVWGWAKRGPRWRVKVVAVNASHLTLTMFTAPARHRKWTEQRGLFDGV